MTATEKQLLKRAVAKYEELRVGHLLERGFERDVFRRFTHGHQIVAYPLLSALSEARQNEVLDGLAPKKREATAYFHLPFCAGKCGYCVYVTSLNPSQDFVSRYLSRLWREVENFKRLVGNAAWNLIEFSTAYIGGGTPTFLSARQIEEFFSKLRAVFRLPSNAEITMESNPETLIGEEGIARLEAAHQAGVSRLSIGVQTFDDNVLRLVGRRHNRTQAVQAFKNAEGVGFENVNIDLIHGLPDANYKRLARDVILAGDLKPASVTAYPLGLKKGSQTYALYLKEPSRFPTKEEYALLQLIAQEHFAQLGYVQNPIYWFAREPRFEYKQQVFKWRECGEMIGFGVSAYSYFNNTQWFNHYDFEQWSRAVDEGALPVWKGRRLDSEELMRRRIVFGLKVVQGVDKMKFTKDFGIAVKQAFGTTIRKLVDLGLVENTETALRLTEKGSLFVDEVSREFFSTEVKSKLAD